MTDAFFDLAVTHLWQVSVLFGIVFLVGKIHWMKNRPHLMLVLWVLFLVKCLIPPVVQSPFSPMASLTPSFETTPVLDQGESHDSIRKIRGETATIGASGTRRGGGSADTVSGGLGDLLAVWPQRIWLGGSAVVLSLFVVNFVLVRNRILRPEADVRRDSDLEKQASDTLRQFETTIGFAAGQVDLVISQESLGPLVFGFFRPKIVLPKEMLLRSDHISPIIAHELCHVWRRDHLLGFLQIAAQVLLWFHPLVWIASRKVNRLCELCCDDDAMRIFAIDSKSYANGLLDVLAMQQVVRPVAMSPGIRPFEVTKQRLKKIVSNRTPTNRQSHAILVCAFLCLVVPSVNNDAKDSKLEKPRPGSFESSSRNPRMNFAEVAQRRTEMDFLLGSWNVIAGDGKSAGESVFSYEKSGKMIREDWTAANGATAQGITFYDPNEACWKMTWVDSVGTIMESSGQWNGETLTLKGWMTSKDGIRKKAQTTIERLSDDQIRCSLIVEINGKMQTISSSIYQRNG